jgi:hypothetical protein
LKLAVVALTLLLSIVAATSAFASPNICESLFESSGNRVRVSSQWPGDLSLRDVHTNFYGGDLRHPSPSSTLGQYIAETGAQSRMMRFDTHGAGLGPEKLLVAVSEESWPALMKLVLKDPNMMTIVGHAATMYGGLFFPNEGGKGGKNPRMPRMNELMPMMLMRSTEARRFAKYTWMTADPRFDGWHDVLKAPWKNENYCAVGGYACCTHWIGNIPIGDKLVSEYTFPANFEQPGDKSPRRSLLRKFTPAKGKEDLAEVWKVPGHEQLADVIGQHESNVQGAMASPGSVQMVFYARTKTERVPVVFWVTTDHRAPIPENPPIFTEPIL